MFTVKERDSLREYVLQLAHADPRVVAGAVVGSLALSEGDRWPDLDLTFAVVDDVSVTEVLEEWTRLLVEKFKAAHLFDLPAGPSIYRVFLLPNCLQFDLSFTPASSFGASGPTFRLLFGSAIEKPPIGPPPAEELFGYAVHHAVRARFCIERGRFWQAEFWISETRNCALNLACRRRGLIAYYGRGYDQLPVEVLDKFRETFVSRLERDELMSALTKVIEGLLSEAEEVRDVAKQVEPQLHELSLRWDP